MVSEEFSQILDGLMLGDGSLRMQLASKNALFRYSGKHKYVAISLKNTFEKEGFTFGPNAPTYYKRKRFPDCDEWHIWTHVNSFLTSQYKRWYPERKKILPSNIVLSPLTVKHWFYGDDGLGYHGDRTDDARFSTHSFSYDEIVLLSELLGKELGTENINIHKHVNNHMLYIRRSQIPLLLEYIGSCDIPCYQYKWIINNRDLYTQYLQNCECIKEKVTHI